MSAPPDRIRLVLPPHADGLRIGLLGGSFNPAHAAHRDISLFAMKRLRLDRVWWLVSPGNPLKDVNGLPTLEARLAAARELARHPSIDVTGVEAAFGTRYTVDTLAALLGRCRNVRFVWLMGADNLAQFHRWKEWQAIAGMVPMAVVDRPPASLRALASPAALTLAPHRIDEARAALLPELSPPAWVFLHGLKSPLSSTAIRNAAQGKAAT